MVQAASPCQLPPLYTQVFSTLHLNLAADDLKVDMTLAHDSPCLAHEHFQQDA